MASASATAPALPILLELQTEATVFISILLHVYQSIIHLHATQQNIKKQHREGTSKGLKNRIRMLVKRNTYSL